MFSPDQPFHRREALAIGITDAQLRGLRYRRLFRGVYILATTPLNLSIWLVAARKVLPGDAVVSHVTALHVSGLIINEPWPLHFSTRARTHSRQKNLRVHEREAPIAVRHVGALPVTSPNRTLVDIATKVSLVELVTAAEWMVQQGLTTLESLGEYAVARHLDGVRTVRRALGLMREKVESPRETMLRLMIVFARLPEPACNLVITDPAGRFLARGDLVFRELRVVVEYDGWYHERDAAQRQRDILRREALEAEGWRIIVVTSADLDAPARSSTACTPRSSIAATPAPPPQFSIMWSKWFPTAS